MDWTVSMSVSFSDISTEIKFCSLLGKKRKVPQIQRKNSCWVVGAHTKEVSPKVRQLSNILWNYSIFIVINQSDRLESKKELHKITKSFLINELFSWNFICTTKMISRVYITYFSNNNLLHFSQGLSRNHNTYGILKSAPLKATKLVLTIPVNGHATTIAKTIALRWQ